MKRTRRMRFFAVLFAAMLLSAAIGVSGADGGHNLTYVGNGEGGQTVGGRYTTIFRLADAEGNESLAYCIDADTYIVEDSRYLRTNLADAGHVTDEQAKRIRAIVNAAYPYVTLEALSAASGIGSLKVAEAVTGAQMAIWDALGVDVGTTGDAHVTALFAYLKGLAPMDAVAAVGSITLVSGSEYDGNGTCTAWFRYRTDAKNADGSDVTLTPGFSEDLAALGATVVSGTAQDGSVEVRASGLPVNANFTFHVQGMQNVGSDAYFYSPAGGRTATQSLVGGYSGNTLLYAEAPFCISVPGDYSLRVCKKDSKTNQGIEGAVFQLADNEGFDDPTRYEKTTDSEGYVAFSGLTEGTWYLREKTPPVGYIPDPEVYPIEINEVPQDVVRFKNTHYGQLRILKIDENERPVEGAVFDIYKGTEKKDGALLHTGLVTDADGVILKGELIPGDYLVVETQAPEGYHLAEDNEAVVTVEPHALETVMMINRTVQRGRIGLAKEDYSSGARLDGAIVGLYRDEACTDEIARFTTKADEVCWQEALLPGKYYAKELEAPDGYILNPAQSVVEVELAEGEEELVVFRNRRRIDTAGNYGLLLLIGLGAVTASGALLIVFRKKLFHKGL